MSELTVSDPLSHTMTMITPGIEQNPILVIDNFLSNATQLVEHAKTEPNFAKVTKDFYPGLRKSAPSGYRAELLPKLKQILTTHFGISNSLKPEVVLCAYSLATMEANSLLPIQRIPHFDTANPNQFACVHYLCDKKFGGTAFYRHKQTQYEAITPNRFKHYTSTLENEATTVGMPPPEYINGDSQLFQQIENIEARFNRILIYRSNQLHSGSIRTEAGLSSYPDRGRLTINTFIRFS